MTDHCWEAVHNKHQPFSHNHRQGSPNRHGQRFEPNQKKIFHTNKFTKEELERQDIAKENHKFVKDHPELLTSQITTLIDSDHNQIRYHLRNIRKEKHGKFFVNDHSTIWSAIECKKKKIQNIYILNFADGLKPGGGYLNGRSAQEETLCRQTLLYPTLVSSPMYSINSKLGPEASDAMIYSADVLVIRDDDNKWIKKQYRFRVNIISSPAVDNRKGFPNNDKIMEERIRKIISLAAYKSSSEAIGSKNALILGAFGCGVFKNDAEMVASKFGKVLCEEKMRYHFDSDVFPIYNDHNGIKQTFQTVLSQIAASLKQKF